MRVRFWGTRGSLPRPGTTTLRHGGNTSCVEIRTGDGTLIVLDCGTGAYGLGQQLLSEMPITGHLLITHTHWDHIQGFPFFAPLFVPGNAWHMYAPRGLGGKLEETLAGQMEYSYFPVTLDALNAALHYEDLTEGEAQVGGARVVVRFLNHPAPTLGYRVEAGGVSVAYITDHEPYSQHVHEVTGLPVHREDQRHIEFLKDADLIIHDSQYTAEEYTQKVGWGHTPMESSIEFAVTANAKRLALYHHDPLRTDDDLDRLVAQFRQSLADQGSQLELFAAAEGQVVDLGEQDGAQAGRPTHAQAPQEPQALAPAEITILIADDDPVLLRVTETALRAEGFSLLTARDGESALRMAREARPDLILLDWDMPGLTGVEACRALRQDPDPELSQTPIVLVTSFAKAEDLEVAFAAGVTDYLTKPFFPPQIRARVNTWLQRKQAERDDG